MSAAELLPAVRELFSRHPKAAGFSPERIAHGLKMLGYVEERPDTYEVAYALEALDAERGEAARAGRRGRAPRRDRASGRGAQGGLAPAPPAGGTR